VHFLEAGVSKPECGRALLRGSGSQGEKRQRNRCNKEKTCMKTIGMAGIGMMGHGIAVNILKRGYPMILLEHPGNQPLDGLKDAGAKTEASAAALGAGSDVIILCVTGSPEVEDVVLRPGGLLEGLRPGAIVIDCSTAIPASTLRIALAVEETGGHFLDAPMTRTPQEAAEGRLNLIVGGAPAVFELCKPLLECFAENITLAGPVGTGHRLKLLHNFVSLGFSAVLAEAAACAERSGIDPHVFAAVLAAGGGEGAILRRLRPYIESGDGSGFRFSISNALKDMSYYTAMAGEAGAVSGMADAARRTYADALEAGPGNSTVPELVSILSGQFTRGGRA
jgi:3-hydroxyisobutyrate dehydrogenase-like beta-hydroxyacid dehydrogenase